MKCHKCPHLKSIEAGEYDSKPWKDTPCAKCQLGEDTFYSVPFDEEQPECTAGGSPAAGDSPVLSDYSCTAADSYSLSPEALLPASTFASCLQGLFTLAPELRDIVVWRFQGLPYKEIAQRQGTSTQLAEMRHKRALRDWPALEALFPEKVAKQSRRKSRR
jgi:hypothetical protein